MEFFIEKNRILNEATDTEMARVKVPGFEASLDGVKDLRQQNRELGTAGWMHQRNFRHVASISGPVLQVAELLDPEFLNRHHKRAFYSWLDEHPEYCAYDRRRAPLRGDQLTFVDGKPLT